MLKHVIVLLNAIYMQISAGDNECVSFSFCILSQYSVVRFQLIKMQCSCTGVNILHEIFSPQCIVDRSASNLIVRKSTVIPRNIRTDRSGQCRPSSLIRVYNI